VIEVWYEDGLSRHVKVATDRNFGRYCRLENKMRSEITESQQHANCSKSVQGGANDVSPTV